MKHKRILSRFMATLTDLVIALLPILIWDLIILTILAGFLSSNILVFLDKVIVYILIISLCFTNAFITYTYGKTIGQMAYDIRIVDNKNKKAAPLKRVLRECLGGMAFLGCFYIYNGLAIPVYLLLNLILILVDKKARGLVDFISQTCPKEVVFDEDVKVNETKKKVRTKEESHVPSKSASFYHYDLHVHSKHSIQGLDTVEEIFQKASALGIKVLSITDEYSVKANIEAEILSKPYNIDYIPGIEMSCQYKGYPIQLLGYGIDYKNNLFIQLENEHLKLERAASKERIEKFKEVTGIDLNFSRLVNQTGSGIVTSEMIIKEALTNPLYEDVQSMKKYRSVENGSQLLYLDYFAPKKPCCVQIELPEIHDVVDSIHFANGVVVLANPKKSCGDDETLIKEILSYGVDGIEVFSSYHGQEDVKLYLKIAREMNCFVSCGSDYYGENGLLVEIGDSKATSTYENVIRVLIERCLKKVEKKA